MSPKQHPNPPGKIEKKRQYRVYTPEFKKEVVAMAKELGTSETARKLGVPPSNVDKWKSGTAMKTASSPEQKELQDENKRLKRKLEQSEAIIEVLKKTAAIFSKDHLT